MLPDIVWTWSEYTDAIIKPSANRWTVETPNDTLTLTAAELEQLARHDLEMISARFADMGVEDESIKRFSHSA